MKYNFETAQGHFWITFDNGYTLSIFNGFGSHTENNFAFYEQQKVRENNDVDHIWKSCFC